MHEQLNMTSTRNDGFIFLIWEMNIEKDQSYKKYFYVFIFKEY